MKGGAEFHTLSSGQRVSYRVSGRLAR